MTGPAVTPDFKDAPYWWEAAPPRTAEPGPPPDRADAVVVGGGFTGLSAALTLARRGVSVAVLEAEVSGFGASTRNSGMTAFLLPTKPSALIARFGEDLGGAMQRAAVEAHDFLADLVAKEGIACHFARSGRFVGAECPAHYDAMGRELEVLGRVARVVGEMVPRAAQGREIGSAYYHGGMLLPSAGAIHPALYHRGLLERAEAAGATIHGRTAVWSIARHGGGFRVETARGSVQAEAVIVATNGHTGAESPWLRRRIVPVGASVTVSEPVEPGLLDSVLPTGRVMTDSKINIFSARRSPDGTRLQFAAARGLLVRDPRRKAEEVRSALATVFPQAAHLRIAFCWTGQMGFAFDRLPHIGERNGIRHALGYCGSGVPMATWLGRKAALQALGDPEGATPFDGRGFPTRPLYRGRPWFLPAAVRYYNWRDRRDRARAA